MTAKTFYENAIISSRYRDGHKAKFSVFSETVGKIWETISVPQNTLKKTALEYRYSSQHSFW